MKPIRLSGNRFFGPFFVASWLLLSSVANAHLLNMTEARARIDENQILTLDLRLDLLSELGSAAAYYDFSQLPEQQIAVIHAEMIDRLRAAILLVQDGEAVAFELISVAPPADKSLRDFENDFLWPMTSVQLRARLASDQPIRMRFLTDFVFEEPIALDMYSSVTDKRKSRWLVAGQTSPALALNASQTDLGSLEEKPLSLSQLWDYVRFGFIHILPSGWDHLLFVLALYLSATGIKQLVLRISLFTLAHSITLGLASYRIVEVPALLTEVLISLTILLAAGANMLRPAREENLRWQKRLGSGLVIFLFGLLHGLGFASSLMDLNQPMEQFLVSLLSFNLGVELGQLCFLAALGIVLGRFKSTDYYHARVVMPLSGITLAVMVFWIFGLVA